MNSGRNTTGFSEEELLKGIKENSPAVLRQIYADQFPSVRSYVLQNSGGGSDAQDVFQDSMMVVWLNVKEGRYDPGSGSIGAYIYRIAKNKWLDKLRSAHTRNVTNMISEVSDRIAEVTEEQRDSERLAHLKQIYSRLDEKCRKVLDMFYYERKSLETIAKELDYDLGSIRTIKYRCMMKLRASSKSSQVNKTST